MTKKGERTKPARRSIQRRLPNSATALPTGVQKSYFMLSEAERAVLNTALEKYRPGQSEPIFVGGHKVLKPALRLMKLYRLVIDEIQDGQAVTRYTRWIDAVEVRGAQEQEVYLMLGPRFEHIWVESKKRLLEYMAKKPANIGLRSQYALRLYDWAKNYVSAGTKRISLEQLRKVLGLESIRDGDGNIIRRASLPVWANLRQRALDTAISGINAKTDLHIQVESLERSAHRRVTAVTFAIKARAAAANGDSSEGAKIVNTGRGKGRVE
jgi:plasmid replication initiation protein